MTRTMRRPVSRRSTTADRARRPPRAVRALALPLAAGALLALGACSSADPPELAVSGAYIPEPATDSVAGGFLVLENTGGTADTLVSVSTEEAESVELHETRDNTMREVRSMEVPANGRLELDRGGNHLMLNRLDRELEEGDIVLLHLHFETSDPISLDVPVESATHTGD